MRRLSTHALQRKRWLRALGIARILFEEDGYHTTYLDEIEAFLRREPVPIPGQSPTCDPDTAARIARLAEHLGRAAGCADDPQDPRRGTGEDLGQVYEEVRQLVAADPQAAYVLLAMYGREHGSGLEVLPHQAADTSCDVAAPAEPAIPPACWYHIDHYPHSRFWGVYDGEDLIAVTVYRKGAEEVTQRLEAKDRTIAALQRQMAALPRPHP